MAVRLLSICLLFLWRASPGVPAPRSVRLVRLGGMANVGQRGARSVFYDGAHLGVQRARHRVGLGVREGLPGSRGQRLPGGVLRGVCGWCPPEARVVYRFSGVCLAGFFCNKSIHYTAWAVFFTLGWVVYTVVGLVSTFWGGQLLNVLGSP